jgi:regulator of sirC expression with transglutaminase-like and TPR domain
LLQAEENKDFAAVKLTVDSLIDPSTDAAAIRAELDHMVTTLDRMLSTLPPKEASTDLARLKALKAFLYRGGWWNDGVAYKYDSDDPLGQNPRHALLAHYLATKQGNCVSMPILFAILGERLGLNVTLSTAPLHVFVKYTDTASGMTYNLEATSGASFTRDLWYRQHMPMSDEAIANGVYLKILSRREAYAVIATSLVEHLLDAERFREAIAVADAILQAYPAHAHALVKKATAYYRLLQRDIIRNYPNERDIPADKLAYAETLYSANLEAFARAEALGWRAPNTSPDNSGGKR